ncbi:MAG: murein biosynthesis integral membrane protein MurJ [Actinomycetales bacterium]|nr:murein biosynthesis integral membrane protein MurJ [Actinomycetales bacterium]
MSSNRASALMATGTLLSRASGIIREVAVIAAIGTAVFADTYSVGNSMPNVVYVLIVGGSLDAVFVPQIVRHMRSDPDGGRAYIDKLLTATLTLLLGLTALAVLAAPLIARLYGSADWSATDRSVAVMFTRYCLPQIVCYGLFEMLSQVLNARGRFGAPMFAPILNNVVVVGTAIAFIAIAGTKVTTGSVTDAQITCLGVGTTLGVAAQALVLLPMLRRTGHPWRLRFDWRGSGLGKALSLARWTFLLVLVNQLGYVVITRLATTANVLAESAKATATGFTTYQKAHLLFLLPHGIVTVSLVTAIVPLMSRHAHAEESEKIGAELSRVLRTLLAFIIPAAGVMLALGPQIGMVLYGSGASNREAGHAIGLTLSIFALALPAYSAYYALLRVFYAHEDTRTPVALTLVLNVVDVLLALWFFNAASIEHKIPALAVAYVTAYWVTVAVTWVLARRRVPSLAAKPIAAQALRMLAITVPASVLAWWVGDVLADINLVSWERALPVAVAAAAGLAFAVVVGRVAGISEFRASLPGLRNLRRR